jgi:hypothetical protein
MPPILTIAQDERRRHKRLPWRAKLTALSYTTAQTRRLDALEATDISFGGMGAVSARHHAEGEQMVVALPRDNGECAYVAAEVVRSSSRGAHCHVGLEFRHDVDPLCGPGSAA